MTNSPPPIRQRAIQTAQKILAAQPIYLDTETTGLENSDEIIEISQPGDLSHAQLLLWRMR